MYRYRDYYHDQRHGHDFINLGLKHIDRDPYREVLELRPNHTISSFRRQLKTHDYMTTSLPFPNHL